jgi:mannose-6-phosphate isomerase-like protein (cupin superfamily)
MTLTKPTEIRPWGAYQNLFEATGFLVKLIEVAPGHRLSLQRHFKREEFWIVVAGEGRFELDGVERAIAPGEMLRVGVKQVHRVANVGTEPLVILELQKGACDEGDIERLADDYRRGSLNAKRRSRSRRFASNAGT